MSDNETTQNPAPSPAPAGGNDGPPPIAERISMMMNNPAYMDAAHPAHRGVVNQVRLLHLEQERLERGAPEPKADDDELLSTDDPSLEELPPTSELARQAGVDIPDLPAGIEYTDSAMADFLSWTLDEGLTKGAVQSILTDYAQWLTIAGRSTTGERPGDAEEWTQRLKSYGLSEAQATRLVKWHQQNSEHAAAEAVEDPLHQRRAQS